MITVTSKNPQSIGNSTIGETAVVSHYKLAAKLAHCFPSKHVKSTHYRLANETPSKWRWRADSGPRLDAGYVAYCNLTLRFP